MIRTTTGHSGQLLLNVNFSHRDDEYALIRYSSITVHHSTQYTWQQNNIETPKQRLLYVGHDNKQSSGAFHNHRTLKTEKISYSNAGESIQYIYKVPFD